ncbi:hypothetical protein B484DRAFT_459732 [Ochromonadaceae sp. CCMP2298]|nr:hypothetical protein B484DRAFT_459732 [Ochromonadaceae sp. CCMP2298]
MYMYIGVRQEYRGLNICDTCRVAAPTLALAPLQPSDEQQYKRRPLSSTPQQPFSPAVSSSSGADPCPPPPNSPTAKR